MWYENPLASLLAAALAVPLLSGPGPAAAQVHGPDRFPGYDPGRCAVATRMIDAVNRHDFRDTTIHSATRDTLFSATVESILACQEVFSPAPTAESERLNAARVQRFTGQDDAAIETERRHLASLAGSPAGERAWALSLMLQDNLAGMPARLGRALELLEEMDALGPAAGGLPVVSRFYIVTAAIAHDDLDLMREQTAALMEAWEALEPEERDWRLIWMLTAVYHSAEMDALVVGQDAALEALETLHAIIPSSQSRVHGQIRGLQRMYRLMDQEAPPLVADFWYNAGAPGPDRPAPGRVSLVLPLRRPCTEANRCLSMVDAARRLDHAFGDQGLDITFRTRTVGFYADTAPALPQAEARYDSAYFLHDVEIPGALAIAETNYSFMADGRRVNEPTTDDLNYLQARLVVIDRDGIVRFVASDWNPVLEPRLTDLIGRLVGDPTAGGGGGGGPP